MSEETATRIATALEKLATDLHELLEMAKKSQE